MKPFFTTGDVARYCHVSISTIFRWIKEGYLPAYTTPGGHHRILPSEFRAFLERHRMPTDEAFLSGAEAEKRILIVDDEPQVTELITRALSNDNDQFEIVSTDDGFEAGMLLTSFEPHLVILDLMMPTLNGFQICKRIRANPDTADIKILVVTGFADPDNVERILALGADDYMEKPLNTEEFLEKIDQLVAAE